MFLATPEILELVATAYGVGAAATSLLQARQMLRHRRSCDVSARFFAAYTGGYVVWLLYGFSIQSIPLIVVDALGVLCGGLTLGITLALRGSLLRPRQWNAC
jgi:uncharacterized protein with PQ loop repeat